MLTFTPSHLQQAIFNEIGASNRHVVIKATAGSGKTRTLEEAFKYLPKGASCVMLALNKSIATELESRGLPGKTFHSLCYGASMSFKKCKQVDHNKKYDVIDSVCGDSAPLYGQFLLKLVNLGKNAGIGCLIDDTAENWISLVNHHDIELESDKADMATAIAYASKVLKASNAWRTIDFDDMMYLCVKEGLTLPKFDFVFVDESQDTNAIGRAVLRKIMHANSRLFAVGDEFQSIYGFRGADSTAMDMLIQEFDAKQLPLSISYRCSKAVVDFARSFCPTIEAAPDAIQGSVTDLGTKFNIKEFKGTDLIVCRTTRPLITLAYRMLKERMPVRILGKEIGQGLKSLIKKMNAKGIDALQDKLTAWTAREVEKARAKRNEAKAEAIQDKSDCVLFLIDSLSENSRTIPALESVIDSLFADHASATRLSTVHKAKGLEADRVYWLNSSQCPAKWAKQDWQIRQEINICFVAATRAKSELVLIEEPKKV